MQTERIIDMEQQLARIALGAGILQRSVSAIFPYGISSRRTRQRRSEDDPWARDCERSS
jgi:hypothetical protein